MKIEEEEINIGKELYEKALAEKEYEQQQQQQQQQGPRMHAKGRHRKSKKQRNHRGKLNLTKDQANWPQVSGKGVGVVPGINLFRLEQEGGLSKEKVVKALRDRLDKQQAIKDQVRLCKN